MSLLEISHSVPSQAVVAGGIDASGLHTGWHYSPPAATRPAPQRNAAAAGQPEHWLAATLDHVGRGLVVVAAGGRVVYANRLARQALDEPGHPLELDGGQITARRAGDGQALAEALDAALRRGLRRLLNLGHAGDDRVAVAVLPLPPHAMGPTTGGAVLLSLPLARRTQDLALQSYARLCDLTKAETAVLEALVAGDRPTDIAKDKGVAMSTVRTQICQLRLKTGSHSIREIVQRVVGLPPMLGVVQ